MNKIATLLSRITGSSTQSKDISQKIDKKFIVNETDPLEIKFAKHFSGAAGKFFFCESTDEFKSTILEMFKSNEWKNPFYSDASFLDTINDILPKKSVSIDNCDCFFTTCEFLIAIEGSIMITAKHMSGKRLSELPKDFVVIAKISQIVDEIGDGLRGIKDRYSNNLPSKITTLKGPNRHLKQTDSKIGSHDPKEIYLVLLDD